MINHMKLCILHHHHLAPTSKPQTGANIRLQHLCKGIQHRLPTSRLDFVCKEDVEGNWKEHIAKHLQYAKPDVILCTQIEDVALLPTRQELQNTPVITDLYAPRLMETMFEQDRGEVSHHLLLALHRSDAYLAAHRLQRDHWTALLRLIGVSELSTRMLMTPLALDIERSTRPKTLSLVGGGRVWPWQHPWDNLQQLLRILDNQDNGQIHWFSPPDQSVPFTHPRLMVHPWTSREAYRSVIAKADFGLDLNPDSPERYLACAFRHMEFLGCNKPILSANQNILTRSQPKLCRHVDFTDETAVLQALNQPLPKKALQQFQEQHLPQNIVGSLIQWLQDPSCRTVKPHLLVEALQPQQQNFEAITKLEELEQQIHELEKTRLHQSTLLEQANLQVQQGTASLLKVTTAMEQLSAFKNDVAHNWSDFIQQQQEHIQSLQQQLNDLLADNAKKSAELAAMDQLRARLENDLQHLREELNNRKPLWRR